jgi:hypothetical protein
VPRPQGAACDIGAVEVAPPGASTRAPAGVSATGATLAGSASNPGAAAGSVFFQYGTSASYGSQTQGQPLAAGAPGASLSAGVAGLTPHVTYHYRAVAITAEGTSYGADRTCTTLLPPPPLITGLSQTHRSWREGTRLAAISRSARTPVGTTFTLGLSEAARLTLAFTQQVAGRTVGHRCVAATRGNRSRPSCKRTVVRGTLSLAGHAGTNWVAFQGPISRARRLSRGAYALQLTAKDAYGPSSATGRIAFAITG